MKDKITEKLINAAGGKFSRQLAIDLSAADSGQIFKWFLASKLFGARISADIAMRTYKAFESYGVITPEEILRTGWDGLVDILDEGGYARYDFSTAAKLLEIVTDLEDVYGGDLNRLHREAENEEDLETRLKDMGKGIGDVTVNIFLREMRLVWPKAKPEPSEMVKLAARHLGLIKPGKDALKSLENVWLEQKVRAKDFCDFEAALLRLGKDYCKKAKHDACPMKSDCRH